MRIYILACSILAVLTVAFQQRSEKFPVAEATVNSPLPATPGTEQGIATADSIVFQSTDGGQTWQDISAGLPLQLGANNVVVNEGKIYLATQEGLYHSPLASGIMAWEKAPMLNGNVGLIFSGKNSLFTYSYDNGLFQETSVETGVWKPVFTHLNSQVIRSVLQTDESTILVGAENGIYKSTDGGATSRLVFSNGTVTSLMEENGVLIGAGQKGIVRSTDNGEHWDLVLTEDGAMRQTSSLDGRFVAVSEGTYLYNDVKDDPEHGASRLRTSTDAGKTWQRIDASLVPVWLLYSQGESSFQSRKINDVKQVGQYLVCSLEAGIFRSADQGQTWEFILPASGRYNYKFAVSGNVIYAVRAFSGC